MSGTIWAPSCLFSKTFSVDNNSGARTASKPFVSTSVNYHKITSHEVIVVCNYVSHQEQFKPTQTPLEQCRNAEIAGAATAPALKTSEDRFRD